MWVNAERERWDGPYRVRFWTICRDDRPVMDMHDEAAADEFCAMMNAYQKKVAEGNAPARYDD